MGVVVLGDKAFEAEGPITTGLPDFTTASVSDAGSGCDRVASAPPVIVGIDGSKDAVRAAIWAVDEALKRGTFVRLVHVITGHRRNRDRGYAYAGQILHKASEAVHSVDESVIVDSDVFEGDLVTQLVEVSRGAPLICLGSAKADSTVAELQRRAQSPVAIMRRESPRRFGRRHHSEYEKEAPSAAPAVR